MSSKSTLILSLDNEHVYHDCSDNTVNIEVSKENVKEFGYDDDMVVLIIPADCDLGRQLQLAYQDPDTFPKIIIDRLSEANGYSDKFKNVLSKITDLQSCIHIMHNLFNQIQPADGRKAMCKNSRVRWTACECNLTGKECDGLGTYKEYGNLGMSYNYQCGKKETAEGC